MTTTVGPSDVVVELEFVGVGAHTDGVRFVFDFVVDPELDNVFGENVALEKELVVVLQGVERSVERAGKGRNLFQFFRLEIVDVLVEVTLVQTAKAIR